MELSARPMAASGGWLEKKCYWCGQYFKQGEQLVLIVPRHEYKIKYPKLARNVVMHLSEYTELSKKCNDDEATMLATLGNHVKKRVTEELTEEQQLECDTFKKVCRSMGFNIETNTKDEIHMRKSRTSLTLVYIPRSKRLALRKRGNSGLMDGMFMLEVEAKVFNAMHAILGDGKKNDFTVEGIMNQALKETHKIMGIGEHRP